MTKYGRYLVALLMSLGTLEALAEETTSSIPLDARQTIKADSLTKSSDGSWTSPVMTAPFPFDELIYSWDIRLPVDQAFRVFLKADFADGKTTDWQYGGFWGSVKDPVTSRSMPKFEDGIVDMDWLKLKRKATTYQFKVEQASTAALTVVPGFHIVLTDNSPTAALMAEHGDKKSSSPLSARVLDLPYRRQMHSDGTMMPNRCQSAALATAMQYFGTSVTLEQIVAKIYDPEYQYPGLWPRVIGAAHDFGFDGYIDRFRDWDRVRQALAEHKVILCSIRMKKDDCKEPPYPSMGNHIVALNGITEDGQVIVTDSFLGKSGRGYRCQWLIEDFERIWMKTKNGVAMVISPPLNAEIREIETIPVFPHGRTPITGDDH